MTHLNSECSECCSTKPDGLNQKCRKHATAPSDPNTDGCINSCMPSCKLQNDIHGWPADAMTHLKTAPQVQHSGSRHDCSRCGPARLHSCQAPQPPGSPTRPPSRQSMAQGTLNYIVGIGSCHAANQNSKAQASQAPHQRDVCCR